MGRKIFEVVTTGDLLRLEMQNHRFDGNIEFMIHLDEASKVTDYRKISEVPSTCACCGSAIVKKVAESLGKAKVRFTLEYFEEETQ